MIRCHSVNKVFLTLLSGRVLSFLEPRTSRLFSHALLGSSLRPIFPARQRTQLIHHGFTRLLFLFLRGCVFGKGRRWFVFFVRVSGLSWGQFFPHVVQFISQGFDQGFFFHPVEWSDWSATDVVGQPSGRSFPTGDPPAIVPCKIASVD